MQKQRFYIDTQGTDDKAYHEAIEFANELAAKDSAIQNVILLAYSKDNVQYFNRLYGDKIVKKLHKGFKFRGNAFYKIETVKKYQETYISQDIVIAVGLDDDVLSKLDAFLRVKAIINIPWMRDRVDKWIRTWNPIELRGKDLINPFPEPAQIIQIAFTDLKESINMSVLHPFDEANIKTYVRALHKYESSLDIDVIEAYLKKNGWTISNAQYVAKLLRTLKAKRHFVGGERTGLQHYYKRWQKAVSVN